MRLLAFATECTMWWAVYGPSQSYTHTLGCEPFRRLTGVVPQRQTYELYSSGNQSFCQSTVCCSSVDRLGEEGVFFQVGPVEIRAQSWVHLLFGTPESQEGHAHGWNMHTPLGLYKSQSPGLGSLRAVWHCQERPKQRC